MNRTSSLCTIALLIGALGPGTALAAGGMALDSRAAFVSGGVGLTSQEELKSRERDFNLKLVFTLTEGNYVADVDVEIRDAAGKTVLAHDAPGPLLMAKLPRGTYTVNATYEGRTQSRKINIGGGLVTAQFRWPSNPQTDFPLQSDRG